MTVTPRGCGRSPIRVCASSTTISVWIQTSPSGCHSGSCGQPASACSSGKSRCDDAEIVRELQPGGWSRREEQQLLDFPPDRVRPADRRAAGGGRQPASVRPCPARTGGELNPAQHAQAVVGERLRVHHSQESSLQQIAPAVERIDVLAGQRIPGDGVDSEVAAPRGFRQAPSTDRRSPRTPCAPALSWIRAAAERRRCPRPCRR